MSSNWKYGYLALIAGVLLVPNAQGGEVSSQQGQTSMAGHCLKAAGAQEMQPIREMARAMSPEVILDRMFSAIEPNFQKALLSKPAEPGKLVKRPEAMRDPKYFQPAIATVPLQNRWVNVTTDGRVLEPAASSSHSVPDPNWSRIPGESKGEPQKKPSLPELFSPAVPQRY